ncbi:hypothetical protein ACH3VR_22845 [Microbacterium sp. B2969]|uniref:Uncharacterized protein n=1 Tax=Microbacterium alkaliflavum TaxID=3248839 RepID=A0ABW7QG89_9MICO
MDDDAVEAGELLARYGIKRGLTEKESEMNVLGTSLLNGGLLFLLPVLLFFNYWAASVDTVECGGDSDCEASIAIISLALLLGLIGILAVSITVSVVLLIRRRLAAYVPIVAGFLMFACTAVAYLAESGR